MKTDLLSPLCGDHNVGALYRSMNCGDSLYEDVEKPIASRHGSKWQSLVASIALALRYTWADVRRRPRNCCIGVLAVFCVVFFTGILIGTISKTPFFLLRFSELSVGEMDVVVQAGDGARLMNFTELDSKMENSSAVEGIAPRWIARATLRSQTDVAASHARTRSSETQVSSSSGVDSSAARSDDLRSVPVTVIIFDSQREKRVGIGRGWKYREIGYGETQVYYSAVEYIGARPNVGERVNMALDLKPLLSTFGNASADSRVYKPTNVTTVQDFLLVQFFELNNITEDSFDPLEVFGGQLTVNLADAVVDVDGKYSLIFGNVALLDHRYLVEQLVSDNCLNGPESIYPTEESEITFFPTFASVLGIDNFLNSVQMLDHVYMTIAIFKDRFNMYYSSTGVRNRLMTLKSNAFMYEVGVDYNGSVAYPLSESMEGFEMLRVILSSAFVTIVVGVVILAAILVYMLLHTNAEERQFELAMIRAQGMRKPQLALILITQSLVFTIPGVILGVCFILITNAVVEMLLREFTVAPASLSRISPTAIIVSILLGFALPLLSNWSPTRNALRASLRDALDVYRQADNETHVAAIRLTELGLDTWQFVLAISLITAGFVVYYLIPMAFLTTNFELFFLLLDLIFLWMMIGCCMMVYVLQPYVGRLALWLMIWGPDRRLHTFILKNMRSHSGRNARAFMMFLICTAAIISGGVIFQAVGNASRQLTEILVGADVLVASYSFNNPLERDLLDAFLTARQAEGVVESWAYASFPAADYPQLVSSTKLASPVTAGISMKVVALSDDFMNAVFKEYNMPKRTDDRFPYPTTWYGEKDIVKSMYAYPPSSRAEKDQENAEGSRVIATGLRREEIQPNISLKVNRTIPVMIASSAEEVMGLNVGDSGAQLRFTYAATARSVHTLFNVEVRALMKRVSGFFAITSLPIAFRMGAVLIPERDFLSIINPIDSDFNEGSNVSLADGAVTSIRYQSLFIRLHRSITAPERRTFTNALQANTDPTLHTTVDTTEITTQINSVSQLIMSFFYFTAVISIILCTFMMWLTFVSNVRLHAWSYGVLRSLGFTTAQLTRASIYEALSIVLSALVLGIAIGTVAALALSLQLGSFMVVPFSFTVPYVLMTIIVGLSLVAAVAGSVIPFRGLSERPIASILKGC